MIGWVRTAGGLIAVISATFPLAIAQAVVLKAGIPGAAVLPRFWHRFCLRILGIRVRIFGEMETGRPVLLVTNHVSWTDIHVLGSLGNVAFIAKSEVGRWPVIGRLSRLQGTIFVDRVQRRATGKQAREIGARLAAGDAMVLFAEGTTSDGNSILPFKSPLFAAAALATGSRPVAIQPVAIAYTRFHGLPMGRGFRRHAAWIGGQELLPHLVQLLQEGAMDVEVRFGKPIEFPDGADRKQAARMAESQVRGMMASALRGNPGGR